MDIELPSPIKSHTPTSDLISCCDQLDNVVDTIALIGALDAGRVVERRRSVTAQQRMFDELIEKLEDITGELRATIMLSLNQEHERRGSRD